MLLVSDFYPPVLGGLENHVADLAAALARSGCEVHVATLTREPTPRPGVTCHVIDSLGGRFIHYQDPVRTFHPPVPDPLARRQLEAVIAAVDPDVIHGHSWLTVSVPPRYADRLVMTLHDYSLACQLRTLLTADGRRCHGPAPLKCVRCSSQMPGTLRHPAMMIGTRIGRGRLHPRRVITVSERVRQRLADVLPVPAADVRVIGNFVDAQLSEQAATATPTVPPSRDFVLFAGDPGLHKGIDTVTRAWQQQPAPELPLVMAITRPVTVALPDNVVAMQMSRPKVLEAIRNALCVVVPSTWDDPCPTVALEALTLGTPVVASAVGGLPEVVSDGLNGFLIRPSQPADIVARVEQLAADPDLLDRLSAGARAAAVRFSSDRIVPQILAVYAEVLAQRRPDPMAARSGH